MKAVLGLLLVVLMSSCMEVSVDPGFIALLSFEADARIGEVDGEAALTDIIGLTVGPTGTVFVTQWLVPHVSEFSVDGRLLRTFGRGGRGPGEFIQPGFVGFVGDTLWASGRGPLALFDQDGVVIRHMSFRRVLGEEGMSYLPARMLTGGVLISDVTYASHLAARGELTRVPILVTAEDGDVLDTLAWKRIAPSMVEIRTNIDNGVMYTNVEELGGPSSATSPYGTAIVLLGVQVSDGQTIVEATWIRPSGDTVSVVVDSTATSPFDPAVKEQVASRLAGYYEDISPVRARNMHDLALEQIPWPETRPPYSEAVLGADERLWLKRDIVADSARWEVWEMEWGAVAETWLPSDLDLKFADESQLWGIRKDSLDVPFMFRYVQR
jgi:hypothetical protein